MKGMKDFLLLYVICFFLTLFALIIFANCNNKLDTPR